MSQDFRESYRGCDNVVKRGEKSRRIFKSKGQMGGTSRVQLFTSTQDL